MHAIKSIAARSRGKCTIFPEIGPEAPFAEKRSGQVLRRHEPQDLCWILIGLIHKREVTARTWYPFISFGHFVFLRFDVLFRPLPIVF